MNKGLLIAAICLLPLALTGCTSDGLSQQEGQPAPHFGDAVKRNILAQTVDPDAGQYQEPQTMNGARAGLAQKRYVTGNVIQPADTSVSGLSQNGGSGSAGGSSSNGGSNSNSSSSGSGGSTGP